MVFITVSIIPHIMIILIIMNTRITLFHFNDLHGNYLAFPQMINHVANARKQGDILVFDCGDSVSDVFDGTLQAELMNMMGVDAWLPGDHDIEDYTEDQMHKIVETVRFPVVAANLEMNPRVVSCPSQVRPHIVLEQAGIKLGIMGLMQNLPRQGPYYTITDSHSRCLRLLETLRSSTDLTILLSHQGYKEDCALAAMGAADLIIGGHSHTKLFSPKLIAGSVVCQAGGHGEYLGKLLVSGTERDTWSVKGELIPLGNLDMTHPEAMKLIDHYRLHYSSETGEKLGVARACFGGDKYAENPVGSFVARAIKHMTGCDVVLYNATAVNNLLLAGDVVRADLHRILHWDNPLHQLELSGAELKEVLVKSIEHRYFFIHTAGVRITGKPPDIRCEVNERLVTDSDTLHVVAADFLRQGGQIRGTAFPALKQAPGSPLDLQVRDLVEDYLVRTGEITSPEEPAWRLSTNP